MTVDNVASMPGAFASWIKHFPGQKTQSCVGATVVFPHAGAAAASYRKLALALAARGDTFVVQYPQRAERINEPPPETVQDLARDLFDTAPWQHVAPLRLFGHSMGAVVAFEFARIAENRGVTVQKLWVSSGPVPSTVGNLPELPTTGPELLADLTDLGGTDPRLLADAEFAELLTTAARGDYQALNRYHCPEGVRIRADIHAVGGRHDHRIDIRTLREWAAHTEGAFTLSFFDGGHFYVNEHLDALANRVITDA
ncbi:thioesterase II family protein [Mycobacterium noviomagense]|uniref:Thioesterase TesA n=1 Tax=Mycobacterium noviomagense TaxID=459858 RepID=A0A7I7P7X1_9MYCO|nr:alpha/beta fold hydrolase [Mycobacterium noviomagense]ORB18813.1 thioesterase [Mycobacterium noviomagense]BBY04759.1 thioesterase [Mycobacterium noviomagense]